MGPVRVCIQKKFAGEAPNPSGRSYEILKTHEYPLKSHAWSSVQQRSILHKPENVGPFEIFAYAVSYFRSLSGVRGMLFHDL